MNLLSAIYDQQGLIVVPYREPSLAVHASGNITLVTLLKISTNPILYTSPDSVFDLSACEEVFLPEFSRGICALSLRMGRERLMEALLTKRQYTATEALQARIVEAVLTAQEFREQMQRVSKLSVSATRLASELATRSRHLSIEQAETIERYAFAMRFTSADQKEGMSAFLEKRQPRFSN